MKARQTPLDKTCSKCQISKPLSAFNKDQSTKDGLNRRCKECVREYQKTWSKTDKGRESLRKWVKNNPEKRKAAFARRWAKLTPEQKSDIHYRNAYGVTYNQVQEFLKNQQYGCAICETKDPKWGKVSYWHVDHDHKTNCIRGVLCFKCNLMIGISKENIDHMITACIYLSFHKGIKLGVSEWGGFKPGGMPCGKKSKMGRKIKSVA